MAGSASCVQVVFCLPVRRTMAGSPSSSPPCGDSPAVREYLVEALWGIWSDPAQAQVSPFAAIVSILKRGSRHLISLDGTGRPSRMLGSNLTGATRWSHFRQRVTAAAVPPESSDKLE